MLSTAQVNKNLKDMLAELRQTRTSANYLLKKIADGMPEQFMGAGAGDGQMSSEDELGIGGPDMAGNGGPPEGDAGAGQEGPEGFGAEKKEQEIIYLMLWLKE